VWVAASAVILFGPPGTGKTTFAKATAGRLGWPFVEVFPSQLVGTDAHGRAGALRDLFDPLLYLDRVVVFIDEVEEIASSRRCGRRSPPRWHASSKRTSSASRGSKATRRALRA
jgi:ATP-dependent 26S proteasome regulatory subunit